MSEQIENQSGLGLRIKNASKIFAPIGGAVGFISDILQPISSVIHVLTVICAIITITLFILYLLRKRRLIYQQLSEYFSQFFVFTVVLCFFWYLGSTSENGFMADNFEAMSDFQSFLVENVKSDAKDGEDISKVFIAGSAALPNTYYLDISNNMLRQGKLAAEDQVVNSIVYYKNGHYDQAALLLDSVFVQGNLKYDLLYRYYESLFYVFKGDTAEVAVKLSSVGLSGNPLMKLAKNAFLFDGVEYYSKLSEISLSDPLLRAFAENLKAKSLFADLKHFYLYENFALEHWIPAMRQNQTALGKNLVHAQDFFFDYAGSYKAYLAATTHESDGHFVWDWPINDPEKKSLAERMWKRIISGEVDRAVLAMVKPVTGKVVDAAGNPVPDVLISDFDGFPKISSEEVFMGTTTDASGSFSFMSGQGHLLRFKSVNASRRFADFFTTVINTEEPLTVVLQEDLKSSLN